MLASRSAMPAVAKGAEDAGDEVISQLTMSPEAYEFLTALTHETGLSGGGVLRKALLLYKVAIDAKRQGLHVGTVRDADRLDEEWVGLEEVPNG